MAYSWDWDSICSTYWGQFYAECANVLWQYVRRTNYPAAEAKASLVRLKALALQRVAVPELVNEALDSAIAQSISAYDACYVELISSCLRRQKE